MSNRLLDPNEMVTVVTTSTDDRIGNSEPVVDPNQRWTIGHDLPDASGAYSLAVSDTCDPTNAHLVAGTADINPLVYTVKSFGALVQAKRNIRCANGEEQEIVRRLLDDGGVESAAEYALWNGIPGWDNAVQPSLSNIDVATVGASAQAPDSLASAIIRRHQLTVAKRYLIHLGVKTALDLSAVGQIYLDGPDPIKNQLRIRAVDAPIVVSPYYPANGIAITGPVVVRVSSPNAWQTWDYTHNKTLIDGFRLIEIDFDPSTSVRVV